MKQLALIVPSRGRPDNVAQLLQSLSDCESRHTDLFIVLDEDDETRFGYYDLPAAWFSILIYPREGKGMAKPLNKAASLLKDDYEYFAFMGDDHRPRTQGWDSFFIDALDSLGTGLVYGNDLHQGEGLPTAVAMTADIVRELDGMVPPNMIHLYLDDFWLKLGKDLGAIKYLNDVVIEHCHPVWGTAPNDAGYDEVNSSEVYSADKVAFDSYVNSPAYAELLAVLK